MTFHTSGHFWPLRQSRSKNYQNEPPETTSGHVRGQDTKMLKTMARVQKSAVLFGLSMKSLVLSGLSTQSPAARGRKSRTLWLESILGPLRQTACDFSSKALYCKEKACTLWLEARKSRTLWLEVKKLRVCGRKSRTLWLERASSVPLRRTAHDFSYKVLYCLVGALRVSQPEAESPLARGWRERPGCH